MPTEPKPRTVKRPKLPSNRWTIDWADLKESFLKSIGGDFSMFANEVNRRSAKEIANPDKSRERWAGYTIGQVGRWLREGYQTPAIGGLDKLAPPIRDKRKYLLQEEGDDFLFDLAVSGADSYFGEWTKRKSIPGLAIDAEIGLVSLASHDVLTAYFKWLNAACYGLELAGVDTEITLRYKADRRLFRRHENTAYETVIRVKEEGKVQDFKSWSPMLSPASLRTLMLYADCLHAEARGVSINTGHGNRNTTGWTVDFIPERQTILVDCDYNGTSFPEDRMTSQFQAAMDKVTGKTSL